MIDQHPTQPTVPSQVVLDRYQLGPLIGRGATARVYRARDLSGRGEVAVKVVPADLDPEGRAAAEVRAAARLSHPGLVQLLDWGDDGEAVHLVWELIDGPSLARVMAAEPPGDPERDARLTDVIADVLDALEHAHSRGVIHRDVKPGNILVDADGRGRLSDLGVARLSGEAGLTATGAVVGTLAYMAPEQATGAPVTGAADVYSACLTLYEALVGANPISGGTPAETLRRAGAAVLAPLADRRPDLPPSLCAAVDAGLARSPAARPHPAELAERLRRAAALLRPGPVGIPPRLWRSWPAVASGAAGAGITLFALLRGTDLGGEPAILAAAVAAGGVCFALVPGLAALGAAIGACLLLGRSAPAAAGLLGALAVVLLVTGRRSPRLLVVPAAAPALFAIGLGPLYAVIAGLIPGVRRRLWAALAGVAAVIAWQLLAGADGILFGSDPIPSGADALAGVEAPVTAARELYRPLAADPRALIGGVLLAAAAMAVPLLLRSRAGWQRVAIALVWAGALWVLVAMLADGSARAIETLLPSCILLGLWAARPWRVLARRDEEAPAAAARGPAG